MTYVTALGRAIAPQVHELIKQLAAHGHRGWVVGGSVRDVLLSELGRRIMKPYDWDVATTATPEQMIKLFRRVIPTGIDHGTVTVMMGKLGIEVTTLRGETTYSDGRHPDEIHFVDDIRADLARRDFTVNAIAFDPLSEQFEDPFDGIGDLKQHCLRAVGDPDARFGEDGLRVLRAARFAATLEFELDPGTRAAIRPSLQSYRKVSLERIRDEWIKALKARTPSRAYQLMLAEGMLEITAPELAALHGCEQNHYHAFDVWGHSMRVLDHTPADDALLRMAALLHDIGKPATRAMSEVTRDYTFYQHEVVGARMAHALLTRLRCSNDERELVTHLIRHHLVVYEPSWSDAAVRRFITRTGPDRWQSILTLARADVLGKGREVTDELANIEELTRRIESVIAQGAAFSIRDLEVTGGELMSALSISPGPLIGQLLRQLLEHVLENPEHNQRERLLAIARSFLESNSSRHQEPSDSGSP